MGLVKLIVGLGNVGPKYAGTRHNVGFEVVDLLADRWQLGLTVEKFHGFFDVAEVDGERIALMKPTTLMNRSGRAVLAAGRFYRLELADLLVIVDDLALPVGKVRVRPDGSSGGHNGLEDIIDRLGSDQWCRLRVGIGQAPGNPVSYVLSRFAEQEQVVMAEALGLAADAAACWVKNGCHATMNQFN